MFCIYFALLSHILFATWFRRCLSIRTNNFFNLNNQKSIFKDTMKTSRLAMINRNPLAPIKTRTHKIKRSPSLTITFFFLCLSALFAVTKKKQKKKPQSCHSFSAPLFYIYDKRIFYSSAIRIV